MKHNKRRLLLGHSTRKSQIQMAESIGAIIIVTLIIVFGIVFYSKIQSSSISAAKRTQQSLTAVELAQRLAALPELSCAQATVTDAACIDLHKAIAFKNILDADPNAQDYYGIILGKAKLDLVVIYTYDSTSPVFQPPFNPTVNTDYGLPYLTLYENVPSGDVNIKPVFIPFALWNGLNHEYALAYLAVYAYGAST
jgi:hypothetical protein